MINKLRAIKLSLIHLWIGLAILIVNFCFGQLALAAPVTYSSDTTVTLTAGSVTIKANSVADTVVVNAATLVPTMSNTTGGNFVVTSASNLTVTQTGAGTITQTCSSGVAQVTISQSSGSSTFTITPTGSACSSGNTSGGGGSNSGGGGGGGYIPPPVAPIVASSTVSSSSAVTTSSSTSTVTTSSSVTTSPPFSSTTSPQDQLNLLLAALHNLQAQAGQINAPSTVGVANGSFKRNLSVGMRGDDVKALQLFLIQQSSGPAAQKLARNGASRLFGSFTKKALMEFQKVKSIKPATGYFGAKTRAYVNSLGQ